MGKNDLVMVNKNHKEDTRILTYDETLQRLEADKAIERTIRGHYKKLVTEL